MVDSAFGKLILLDPNGPEQEFELAKAKISLGRAATNDIILSDVRVSRSHAQLECGPQGCTLIDLGSSNGTRLNGNPVERAVIKPGDTISLGSQQLRYDVADLSQDLGLTQIDSQSQLELTMNQEFLPKAINETNSPSLVVFTADKTWSFDLSEQEQVAIGRDEDCAVFIDSVKVSRRHAEVIYTGGAYVLKDLGSTNGTWLRDQRVEKVILQDGDVFRVGAAQIIFKAGFQEQSLTMANERLARPNVRRIVVFVPGMMGSELWLGSERVWPNVKTIFTNPEIFTYPSKVPLEPRGILDELVIVPNLIKLDQYNRLGDYLVEELSYHRGVDFFEFPYDWRQDVRISARQLGDLVESLPAGQPVTIIAHSLGTMVSRYYIERLGGSARVERAILMGGPHLGTPKILTSMLIAPEVLPFGIMGERLRQIIMTFHSNYQIIPIYDVGVDQHGSKINFLKDESWLAPEYIPLLRQGRKFRRELGGLQGFPYVSIFGYGLKTVSNVVLSRDANGGIQKVDYVNGMAGDDSILEQSAFLQGSEIHPVRQHHGALFVDNDVKMRLKLELSRP